MMVKATVAYDDVSGTDVIYGSYVLNSLLPSGFLKVHKEWTRLWTSAYTSTPDDDEKQDKVVSMLAGSAAENFNVPLYMKYQDLIHTKEYVKKHSYLSDQDVMITLRDYYVIEEGRDMTSVPRCAGFIKPSYHPGYVLLVANENEPSFKEFITVLKNGEKIFDGSKFITSVRSKLRRLKTERDGPALSTSDEFYHTEDHVISFHCPTWPNCALDWTRRHRPGGWPTKELVDKIIKDGSHIVCTGHAISPLKDYEYRRSFSKAEITLAHSLHDNHRRIYLFVKLLQNLHLKEPKALATYHLKTTLYWMVEQEKPEIWHLCNTALALTRFLDRLISSLTSHNIPNYFVPENNMIDHIPLINIKAILNKLRDIRKAPMRYIMAFFEEYTLSVPEEPYSYCPPREELRIWNDMLFKNTQKKDYREQAVLTAAIQSIHRCSLHLALSWLIEFTIFCRAQNISQPTGFCRQMFACIGDTMKTAYEHKVMRQLGREDLHELVSYVRGEFADTVKQFVAREDVGKVNITEIFRCFQEYIRDYRV